MFGLFGARRELRVLDRFLREHCAELDNTNFGSPVERAMLVISKLRAHNNAQRHIGARDLRGPFKVTPPPQPVAAPSARRVVPDIVRSTQPPGAVSGEKSHKN